MSDFEQTADTLATLARETAEDIFDALTTDDPEPEPIPERIHNMAHFHAHLDDEFGTPLPPLDPATATRVLDAGQERAGYGEAGALHRDGGGAPAIARKFKRADVTVQTREYPIVVRGDVCGPLAVTPMIVGLAPHRILRVVTHVATGYRVRVPGEFWLDPTAADLRIWVESLLDAAPDPEWWDRLASRLKGALPGGGYGWHRTPGKNKAERAEVMARANDLFVSRRFPAVLP